MRLPLRRGLKSECPLMRRIFLLVMVFLDEDFFVLVDDSGFWRKMHLDFLRLRSDFGQDMEKTRTASEGRVRVVGGKSWNSNGVAGLLADLLENFQARVSIGPGGGICGGSEVLETKSPEIEWLFFHELAQLLIG